MRRYEVEYLNGSIETMTANTIAENLLAQVDDEGHCQLLMAEIIDHHHDTTDIKKEDGHYNTKHGTKRKKQTTKGWELCVEWKDGSQTWVQLNDLKNAYPVKLADYARPNKIDDEPAFSWWVPYTIKKRTAIIGKIKSKYWQHTHKYGIRVPRTVQEALDIDAEENNSYWKDAIAQEMAKIKNAFELYEGDDTLHL
mmetsp:Transcript_8849/g.12994  ORF Transcript_8849/g.12994 Transcript_8849/m.12994 type:complete len:196 (+) Transcript_8849:683-1270(+)